MISISKLVRILLPVTVRGWTHDTAMIPVQGAVAGAAYTAGDALGLQFPIPLPDGARSGSIQRVVFMDRAKQLAPVDLEIFRKSIAQTADNGAFTVSDTEHLQHLGTISLVSFQSYNAEASATLLNVGFTFALRDGDQLIGQSVTRGAPTLVADRDCGWAFGLLLDPPAA